VTTGNGPGSLWNKLFGNSARAFGSMSVILLVSLAIAPAKDYFSEWRHTQNEYVKLIRTRADAVTLQRHVEPGLQQIWHPELGVVDRCTTCHLGEKEASLGDVTQQPFRKHPAIPHSLTQFGCVICHRGQGTATTVHEAHHSTDAWEEPLLPANYIEASCGQCHLSALRGTPTLNEGRRLLGREGCVHCHNIKLADGSVMTPTDHPPDLGHIAEKTSREWIFAWIKDPQAYAASATMPNFGFNDEDARDVSAFLMAQSTPSAYAPRLAARKSATPTGDADALTAGASLYGQSFCASCHATQNAGGNLVGGDLGPELTRIGSKVKPEWLEEWIRDPGGYFPATEMPHYRFSDQQIGMVAGYLKSKADADLLANVHLEEATQKQIDHGRSLVLEYGCASCHQINGVKKPDNFAPDLSRIGSKPFAQLAFPAGVEHTLPDYLTSKITKPRGFGAGLKMPKFTLAPAQVDALTTALLALTGRANSLPASLRVASEHESQYQPAGRAGQLIRDLRCFSCHSFNGRGGSMAPDLSWEGSSVQRQWLVEFLKNPNTLRPALIRRMPKFNLSDADVNTLTDYIETVYQTPAFDRDGISPASLTPQMAEEGKQLFYSKYACNACHMVDPQKDKGYIGPVLWQAGLRLTPAWTFQWLKNPQALRPGTIEPNQHLDDKDAMALTAYIMTLKLRAKQGANNQ
jgi:mono/diheme cytochrome c family protein